MDLGQTARFRGPEASRLIDIPTITRITELGSGTESPEGRKSVALLTLPTTTEKFPGEC